MYEKNIILSKTVMQLYEEQKILWYKIGIKSFNSEIRRWKIIVQ